MAVIVTGGGGGIGRALALELAAPGSKYSCVIIVGRRISTLEETASLAAGAGGITLEACQADVGTDEGIAAIVKHVGARQIAVCVHNAATMEPIAPLKELSRSDWRTLMAVNVEAPVFLTMALLPQLEEGARVLLMGSDGAAATFIPGLDLYCVSKASLKFIFPGLRDQLKPHGVHVGYVNPGLVDTNMPQAMIGSSLAFNHHIEQRISSNDSHQPSELGRFIAFVLSEQLTSDEYARDGGWDIDLSQHPIEVSDTSERKERMTQGVNAVEAGAE